MTVIYGLWGEELEFPERYLNSPGQNGKTGQLGEPLLSQVKEESGVLVKVDTILIHLKDI